MLEIRIHVCINKLSLIIIPVCLNMSVFVTVSDHENSYGK